MTNGVIHPDHNSWLLSGLRRRSSSDSAQANWAQSGMQLAGPMVEHDPHGPTNCGHHDKLDQMVVAVLKSRGCPADGVYCGSGRYGVAGAKF